MQLPDNTWTEIEVPAGKSATVQNVTTEKVLLHETETEPGNTNRATLTGSIVLLPFRFARLDNSAGASHFYAVGETQSAAITVVV